MMVLRLTWFAALITLGVCVFFTTSTQAFTNNLPLPSKTAATPIVQLRAVDDGKEENTAESTPASTTTAATAQGTPKPVVKCPNCDKCDGSGRILGGIAVVLPWWPIKAYRPCPNFIANGGFYERSGQGLDEIAFGRDSTYEK